MPDARLLRQLSAVLLLLPGLAMAKHPKGDADEKNTTLLFVGGAAGQATSPTLHRLEAHLAELDPGKAIVVFTGNYMEGELPDEGAPGREAAEHALLAHVEATKDFLGRGGRVYYLPGHRDYAGGGSRAVKRMRKFLNRAYRDALNDEEIDVMPRAACGEPDLIELGDKLGLVLLNSQWWMQDWIDDPKSNVGCEVQTRKMFQPILLDLLSGYRGRRLVIASHHPLRSYGEYGGSFTAAAHAEPAPLVGTAWVIARQAGLVDQYQNDPIVRSYLDLLLEEAQRNGRFIVASGHDASQQYLKVVDQVQVVSGTTGQATRVTSAADGELAAAVPGWAELIFGPDGNSEVRFYAGEQDDKVLFTARLPDVIPRGETPAEPAKPLPQGPVSHIYTRGDVWQFGAVTGAMLGSFYSDAYALKLPFPVLDLETEAGGLKPRGMGGGLQTNSLKLKDSQGGEWTMRAVTKDSSRFLTWPQNQATVINRLLDHGYTATHPEAALSVPRLSEAVGVLHPDPKLFYLPDQEALGQYRGFISDEVVLLERKPKVPKEGVLPASLAGEVSPYGPTTFLSCDEMLEKLRDEPTKHRLDQEAMLRARLLDIYIGDWDRHHGQWEFAAIPQADGKTLYRPIARDRDQAFANYNGLGLFIARIGSPMVRVLQPFDGDFRSMTWANYGAKDLDAVVLNGIPHDRWMAIALETRDAITNNVLDEAFAPWHPEAYAQDGVRIRGALEQRREKLVEAAESYFQVVNRHADVIASRHRDVIDLTFEEGGNVRVVAHREKKDGRELEPYFDRLFEPKQTSELRIYALEGDDTLVLHGEASTPIDIRFVGGSGKDVVTGDSLPRQGPLPATAVSVYDDEGGVTIDKSVDVRDRQSNLAAYNAYDQNAEHEPSTLFFTPGLLYNPDDGVFLGGKLTYTQQAWKKVPFAARHDFAAAFATASLGGIAQYDGLFPVSIGQLDQRVSLIAKTPTYARNFYGFTNQYIAAQPTADYYRVRQGQVEGRYGLSYGFGGTRSEVAAQLIGNVLVTENTPDRFVEVSPDVAPGDLGPRYFAGARVYAETNTFDDLQLPTRGIAAFASAEGRYDVQHGNQFSLTYRAGGAWALPFDRNRRFVLITRAMVEGIQGPHPFYFMPTLGGGELRAYHFQQFAGELAFAHTTDLRIDVFRIRTVLPGTIGVNLSADHGRVFGPSVAGNDYHVDFGGGVWWSVLDLVGVSFNYFRSLDGAQRFVFALGPLFSQTGFTSTAPGTHL